ncbi:MAG: N-acetyltransferase family protein [Myxococcota bacterium]|nr:N-acetyltransferase [Deltaproteobacteria bacterium]MDQ3333637.1 N-acetyltransferase family protein [Myxococcota bacterium]
MIRPVRDDDFPAIAAITNHYITTTTYHFAYEPLPVDQYRAMQKPKFPWFAYDDGAVLGYAKAGVWRDRAAYDWTCEIGLYVTESARGRGIGRALYTALLDELARRGFRSAIAGITLPNDPSIELHRKFGFESVGIVRDAGYKHGGWCDVEFFQKRFTTTSSSPPAVI